MRYAHRRNNTFSQRSKRSNRYLRPSSRGGYRMKNRGNFQQQSFRGRNFTRGSQSQYVQSHGGNEKNPLNEYDQYTRYTICESIFHSATACPHRDCMKIFVSESLSAAVLDSVQLIL